MSGRKDIIGVIIRDPGGKLLKEMREALKRHERLLMAKYHIPRDRLDPKAQSTTNLNAGVAVLNRERPIHVART